MRRGPALALLALAALPALARSQGTPNRPPESPIGPEFRVNTYLSGHQTQPAVVARQAVTFSKHAFVWTSDGGDGSGLGVIGRYLYFDWGAEFRVNTYTTGDQQEPTIGMDYGGNLVVAWTSGHDGSGQGIFAQRFLNTTDPLGPEFRVNTYTTGSQYEPGIWETANADFVVVWTSSGGQDGDGAGIFGQRFAADGAPLGAEFRVNTYTIGNQYQPAIASSGGNFVVVWQDAGPGPPGPGVFGQRFDYSGTPLGPQFHVETYTTGLQAAPAVAVNYNDEFVVVWHGDGHDGSDLGIFGQRYSSSGMPVGPEFRANTYTTGRQGFPTVAAGAAGRFLVAWTSQGQDGSADGVFAQTYVNGVPFGPEVRINTYTTGSQASPFVVSAPGDNFVVVWQSEGQDGSGYGVFGQFDHTFVPVELMTIGVE
jgi:hypothetical protein